MQSTNGRIPAAGEQLRVFAPCGMLGYGIPKKSFENGLSHDPHVLAVDAGSTDPGPYYLGSGLSYTNRDMVKRDLTLMLTAAYERQLPVIIGSAGGGGAAAHVVLLLDIVDEVVHEHGLNFPTAVVTSDIDAGMLRGQLAAGRVTCLDSDTELTPEQIDRASNIVAQMGPEPIMAALEEAQLVICGRASDPAVMAAPALLGGYRQELAIHMGKILECGAAAAFPRHGSDGLLGTLLDDAFIVEPSNPDQVCTIDSVAAHTLYERANPTFSQWPGGLLDLSQAVFEQENERAVRVSGSRYETRDKYLVKLEGAASCGYRTITIAGIRDPKLIANFDIYLENVRQRVSDTVLPLREGIDYTLHIRAYGRDGVMSDSEPEKDATPHELGLILEVVASDQKVSQQVLAVSRSAALHSTYPDRTAIAGNLAFPFSPSDIHVGEVYEFNIYHLLQTDDPLELFPMRVADQPRTLLNELRELTGSDRVATTNVG